MRVLRSVLELVILCFRQWFHNEPQLLAKLRDRLFQMCIRMIDTDSSCDDVELVELNSMVELVSLSEGRARARCPCLGHRYCTHGPTRRSYTTYCRCLLSRRNHEATYSQRAQFLQPTPARGADGAVGVR